MPLGITAHKVRSARIVLTNRAVRTAFPWWQRLGLHVVRNDYYSPVPDTRALDDDTFNRRSELVGIDIDLESQLAELRSLRSDFGAEIDALTRTKPSGDRKRFYLDNPSYGSVDAELWWCMLRSLKPQRVMEVGSGFSTLLALDALKRNADEGDPCKYTVVDPYPRVLDAHRSAGGFELVETPVQDVPFEKFAELGAGDILFIDSTHVATMGSDVCFEYLELLPRLNPGVYVHIHDIMLPLDYPRSWVKALYFWNEQYLLQAFLSGNKDFEVKWASRWLSLDHPGELREAFPSFVPGTTKPGSFWIRRVTE